MAYSSIEDKYLSALTAVQFPDAPVEPAMPEQTMPGRQEGDIMLAEAGAGRGSYEGFSPRQAQLNAVPPAEIKAFEPTIKQSLADYLQMSFEKLGMDRNKARKNAQTLIGGASSNLPLDVGLADFVPFLGTTMQLEESGIMAGEAYQSAKRGDYGTAAMQAGGAALGLVPGAASTIKAAKPLVPKAAEMIIEGAERLGTPVRGLNIVESAPQLAIDRVPGVKPGDELIVQHNLTAANLLKADKLGGLPVPSLAISKVGAPLENFGEITLIAPKEMATPSAKNPVFFSDAYTKRFPTIDYSIDTKGEKALRTMLSEVAEKLPSGDYEIDRLLNNWNDRKYSDVLKAKFLDERGELPSKANFEESWKFNSALNNLVGQRNAEYQDWLAKFDESLPDNGVNVKERIFKGYTYSGNRRYAEVNLTNLVKEMKGGAGEEGWNYGVSSLRAVATPKFKTFSQIKASRDKIIDKQSMESIKDKTREAYESLLDRLHKINPQYDSSDALREVVETKNINSLDREYDAPPELKADIGLFIQKLKTLPTEYFEMKPQRAVSLEEFQGAIIPKDTPKKARDVLKKAGITEVHEYSTPEERKGLFDKFGKEMFATMPAAPIGAATMQDKEQK